MKSRRDVNAKIVYWSDEDQCFIGVCPSLFGGGVHGDDEVKVYRELCQVVAEWEAYNRRSKRKKGVRRYGARSRTV